MGARPSLRREWLLRAAGLSIALLGVSTSLSPRIAAQSPSAAEFDVVSIKRVEELRPGGSMRILPDGTLMMTNQPLGTLLNAASPVPVMPRDIVGMPDWMMRENYDVTVKPPAGVTSEQLKTALPAMWRAMFADRMKLVGHVEQREKDAYALVLARSDGRLGPDLKPSTLDCTPRLGTAPPAAPQTIGSVQERQNRCGMSMSRGLLVSGSVTIDQLARSPSGQAGGEIANRTGLAGTYSVKLAYSLERSAGAAPNPNAAVDDAPGLFTAVQEQLGLRLQREKRMTPVFVIDHVERPTAN